MELDKIANTGRDNTPHTRPTAPAKGSYALAESEGSGGSDGGAKVASEQYIAGRSTPGSLVDHHIPALLYAR